MSTFKKLEILVDYAEFDSDELKQAYVNAIRALDEDFDKLGLDTSSTTDEALDDFEKAIGDIDDNQEPDDEDVVEERTVGGLPVGDEEESGDEEEVADEDREDSESEAEAQIETEIEIEESIEIAISEQAEAEEPEDAEEYEEEEEEEEEDLEAYEEDEESEEKEGSESEKGTGS